MNRFLALVVYVMVFLGGFIFTASLGAPELSNNNFFPATDASEQVARVEIDDESQLCQADSHESTFKTFVKKKVKKRYRVRYCEYHLARVVAQKQHIIYDDVVVYCILRSVINERCIRTFVLRGPPAGTIA
ncbi:MAG: hypothetical protein KF744_16330 [Taibaiella sp.]|nr:hypothetical protein [Taibaiella sp.]